MGWFYHSNLKGSPAGGKQMAPEVVTILNGYPTHG